MIETDRSIMIFCSSCCPFFCIAICFTLKSCFVCNFRKEPSHVSATRFSPIRYFTNHPSQGCILPRVLCQSMLRGFRSRLPRQGQSDQEAPYLPGEWTVP